ncbi:hypothetical protein [Paenibacillus sp. sptzw28]|uniref:hypothetical protein n=1 Tax=Paenibacillus sp. sptzw28 TaxID=715179 RepID=UPI0037C7225A
MLRKYTRSPSMHETISFESSIFSVTLCCSLAMTIGLMVGMYSTVYIASQVWLLLKRNTLKQAASPDVNFSDEQTLSTPTIM